MKKYHLKLYNTESREKEEVVPIDGKTIRMYTCGPTVYNYAHIGNFRTYVFEDLLRRTIRYFGYGIQQAMNLTDIDDKTIRGAIEKKVSLDAFTKVFKDAFFEDLQTLCIEKVEHYPHATGYIPEMITIIQGLLEKGVAYRGHDQSIYFAISRFPSYGRLSHLHLGELQAGASQRVATDEYDKENVSDFVLWKAYDPMRDGDIFWESPFGRGRPGWHIECSAMAMKLLGESIDIHVGGVDNMFPHHENEIAQSEAYSCRHFVNYWVHAEHLLVDHRKMSKSLGNFYTLRDLLAKGFTGRQIRYLLLQTHYRTQLNFTFEGLGGAAAALERISDFVARLHGIRREKMGKALDLVLEKALPDDPHKKEMRERILYDVQSEHERDILDAVHIAPILKRTLMQVPQSGQILDRILKGVKEEKERAFPMPLLERALQGHPDTGQILSTIIHEIRDAKESDILDPGQMKPILQKALKTISPQPVVLESILQEIQVKKEHGFILPILKRATEQFDAALSDDLNISQALATVFEMVREVNALCDQGKIGIAEAEDVIDFLLRIDQVLGVLPLGQKEETPPPELEAALKKRETARAEKNWKAADACRDQILEAGYLIEDTPHGVRLKKRTT